MASFSIVTVRIIILGDIRVARDLAGLPGLNIASEQRLVFKRLHRIGRLLGKDSPVVSGDIVPFPVMSMDSKRRILCIRDLASGI